MGKNFAARLGDAKAGDRAAFGSLCEEYHAKVLRLLRGMACLHPLEAEDLAQETFLAAMGGISHFRGDTEASFAAWIFTIARRKAYNGARKASSLRFSENPGGEDARGTGSPEEEAVERVAAAELRAELSRLTPEQEEIVTLRFILGYGISDTAKITGKTQGAVKAAQHRALAALRATMEKRETACG